MKLFFIGADRLRCSSLKTWISQSFLKTASIYFHIQVHANKQRDYLVVICSINAELLTSLINGTNFFAWTKDDKSIPSMWWTYLPGHFLLFECGHFSPFNVSGYDWLPFSGGQTIVEIYGTLEGFPRCPGNIVHCFGWCHTMTPVILRILFGTNSQTSS